METVTLKTLCGCIRSVPVTRGAREYQVAYQAGPTRASWAFSDLQSDLQVATYSRRTFRDEGRRTACGTRIFMEIPQGGERG